mmetsp:Transcript_2934/g.4466  ORF Transcript_2934/g.4466 Transcript_2934/m.4466 type:complete len:695 (-) Transcript_2934:424-2508(-)|eukprot:CAMPEP_0184346448 /NCGR_PEP_ID=MMETSP1089-20130417/14715_1 /TAXON_ID=38269 ORGANISM="Gloeochaete wittrockiana, Strain SAG46.84" /NCGR_SAMPLE_ID=MMETSP1089 /ASSEMBLY_ACC=CAM_ASM_000445 /LENGTH=694 /DNA_ID=CAMNT_0026677131 /DNA_START=110 /DNA_END=2194 /DNA_ORIENTATION=-
MRRVEHIGKVVSKFQFTIVVHSISRLPAALARAGNPIVVNLKRGSSKSWTSQKAVATQQGIAEWESSFDIAVSLYKSSKRTTFDEKNFVFSLKVEGGKKEKTVGTLTVDFAAFPDPPGSTSVTRNLRLTNGTAENSLLKVTFRTRWLRDGSSKSVVGSDTTSKAGSRRSSLDSNASGVSDADSYYDAYEDKSDADENGLSRSKGKSRRNSTDGSHSNNGSFKKLGTSNSSDRLAGRMAALSETEDNEDGELGSTRSSMDIVEQTEYRHSTKENRDSDSTNTAAPLDAETREIIDVCVSRMAAGSDMRWSRGVPVSAVMLFRLLVDFLFNLRGNVDSFSAHLVRSIDDVLQKSFQDSEVLAFWLTNTCTLFFLCKNSQDFCPHFRKSPEGATPSKSKKTKKRSERNADGESDILNLSAALSSAILRVYFALLKNIYFLLHPHLVDAFLENTKHQPILEIPKKKKQKKSKAAGGGGGGTVDGGGGESSAAPATPTGPLLVTNILDNILALLLRNHVPPLITSQLMTQVAYFIDAILFNCIMQRGDLCTTRSALAIKYSLSVLDEWVTLRAKDLPLTGMRACHVREAADVLILRKSFLAEDEVRRAVCPHISPVQLEQLLRLFRTDDLSPESVPEKVLRAVGSSVFGNAGTSPSILLDAYAKTPLSLASYANTKDLTPTALKAIPIPPQLEPYMAFS